MLVKSAAPPRSILGALLALCLLPQGSSLAVVREEGTSNTTTSKSELKAMLKAAKVELQAKMMKSGGASGKWGGIEGNGDWGNLLAGQGWNCVQTILAAGPEPFWSIVESIIAAIDSCKSSTKECTEASFSVTEASLDVLGYLIDFPTDCLMYSCAFTDATKTTRVHPRNFEWTMRSAAIDAGSAITGAVTGSLGVWLQCKETLGDSLGLPGKVATHPWVHPSLVSFVPFIKDFRENAQIIKSHGEGTRWQQGEKVMALLVRLVGVLQSIEETLMHEHNEAKDAKASAEDGCVAASAHIAASALAAGTSLLKGMACSKGEKELPLDITGSTLRTSPPANPVVPEPAKTVPLKEDKCYLDPAKDHILSTCMKWSLLSSFPKTAQLCRKMCCDPNTYGGKEALSYRAEHFLKTAADNYCKGIAKAKPESFLDDKPNMARLSTYSGVKKTNDELQKTRTATELERAQRSITNKNKEAMTKGSESV